MQQIMIIDETRVGLDTLQFYLKDLYMIKTANSPFYAFEFLMRNKPALIILNIDMKQSDGLAFFKKLRTLESCKSIPILILSENEHNPALLDCQNSGNTEILILPVDKGRLIPKITRMLEPKVVVKAKERKINYTVLVVDDDEMSLNTVKLYLNQYYNVLTASSAKEALNILETERPNLILLDIQMPVVDGLALFRIMRKDPKCKNIPVIFETGLADIDTVNECINVGAAGYVVKPVQKDLLIEKIEDIFNKRTIMVITDNLLTITMLRLHLEQDYKLTFAESHKQAFDMLNFKTPELILVDTDHPVSSFYRLKENKLTDKIPILFLTEETSLDVINRCVSLGAGGFIFKPFDKHALQKKLSDVLDK